MKALLLHAREFKSEAEKPSKRIGTTQPEVVSSFDIYMEECVVALFHVENNDGEKQLRSLCREIEKASAQWKTKNLMISGFAHLSSSRPDPEIAKNIFNKVFSHFTEKTEYVVGSSPFGWDKSLLLDIKSHAGSFRFRSL